MAVSSEGIALRPLNPKACRQIRDILDGNPPGNDNNDGDHHDRPDIPTWKEQAGENWQAGNIRGAIGVAALALLRLPVVYSRASRNRSERCRETFRERVNLAAKPFDRWTYEHPRAVRTIGALAVCVAAFAGSFGIGVATAPFA